MGSVKFINLFFFVNHILAIMLLYIYNYIDELTKFVPQNFKNNNVNEGQTSNSPSSILLDIFHIST